MDAADWSSTPCALQDTYTEVAWTMNHSTAFVDMH